MKNLVELSVEILEMLKEYGYYSVIHIDEEDFDKELLSEKKDYYILKPSIEEVAEDYTEINGQFYSPILSSEVRDMAKNDTPFIDFLLQIDEAVYKELKIK